MQFLIQGTTQHPHCYKKGEESAKAITSSHVYKGEAAITGFDTNCDLITYIVDDAIEVMVYNSKNHASQVDYWKSNRNSALIIASGSATVAIAGGLSLIAVPVAATALVISALVPASLGVVRAVQAQHQVNEWSEDLLGKICHQRREAENFEYAFSKNLKGVIVHAEEIQISWENAIKKHLNQFLNRPLNATDITDFFTKNPLEKNRREYANENFKSSFTDAYDASETRFQKMNQKIDARKATIKKERDNKLADLMKNRESAIAPHQHLYELACAPHLIQKREAEQLIKASNVQTLAEINNQQKQLRDIQQHYDAVTSPYYLKYKTEIGPIIRHYENVEREMIKELDGKLKNEEESRDKYAREYANDVINIADLYFKTNATYPTGQKDWDIPIVEATVIG